MLTNKFSTDAIRGAGRPEMTHMLEVTIDQLAHELGMDPLEVRRKNFIPKAGLPVHDAATASCTTRATTTATLDRALEIVDLDAFRAEQARAA